MSKRSYPKRIAGLLACLFGGLSAASAAGPDEARVRQLVDEAMKPVIAEYGIPGLAVAVTIGGQRHFIEYGVASKKPRTDVTRDTLFELGSISKTFTATLTTYAEVEGKLSLGDSVSAHMPELKGSALDNVRLFDLATHTAGGFPLQLPNDVRNRKQLIAYYRGWKPQYEPGTYRSYANPSIGLLGIATAKAMGSSFPALMEGQLFPQLGLQRTYIDVPAGEMKSYAWGYRQGKAVRVTPGPLAEEAYGVKSNTVDMIRFVELNMGIGEVPQPVAKALEATRVGYYRSGEIIQNLVWEQYPYPVEVDRMVQGNSPEMARNAMPATAIEPPMPARADVIVNKTGSTGGFGAYVAYIPEKKIGIVMLANTFYPNAARVKAAYSVLMGLAE